MHLQLLHLSSFSKSFILSLLKYVFIFKFESSGFLNSLLNIVITVVNLLIDVFQAFISIFTSIPEYIDYSYVNEWESFELEVLWLEQDEAYLSWVINKLNYIPTTEDFSNVFSNFGLFGGLLVVCLFVILVFYFIKKIFS